MATYDASRLPFPIVVRPSGIWDSRAPMHTFCKIQKSHQRAYDLTTLCHERISADLLAARDAGTTLEDFLVVKDNNRSRRTWRSYEKAQVDRNLKGELKKPRYSNTRFDLRLAH